MNIFILDQNPTQAARYHCDKHVVKMILESTQMLSTTISILDPCFYQENKHKLLKPCFHNHPCTIWTRESYHNFIWHLNMLSELHREYELRYFKIHDCAYQLNAFYSWRNKNTRMCFTNLALTPFAQAMPPAYKHENAITAYRNYYMGEKKTFAKWNHSEMPDWWIP